jgi:predicted dehydrogenase
MRLALLGIDADVLALARAATQSGEHQVVWACEADDAIEQLREAAPRAKVTGPWEFLLGRSAVGGASVDAVLVARGEEDLRADQLRKLLQEGVPLLVAHPVLDSMLVYYELDMIRQESRGVILPYLPARWHPAVIRLAEMIAGGPEGPLGEAQQIVFERSLAERSRKDVLAQFARDCDLLQALCGELTKVGAMASQGDEEGYANLGVQLSGPSSVLVRWSVGPADPAATAEETVGGQLALVGASGKAVLNMPGGQAWSLETVASGQTTRQSFESWNAPAEALARLETAIGGGEVQPTWADAARSIELADAVRRSLLKGRTVELHNEDFTEQGTFKGLMTSLGCGLLLVTLLVLVVTVSLASLFRSAYVPHIIAAVLGLFLLIQSLKLVFPRE